MRTISGPSPGDAAAPPADFQELFQAHYPRVSRRAAAILGDRYAAEDVAQETFCRLLFNPPRHRSNLAGWLARVATNLSLNRLRGEAGRARRETAVTAREVPAAASAEDDALRGERVALVRRALATLPERQRHCLLLRFAGLSYAEVATATGVAPGSVGKLLARAEEKFRREYLRLNGGMADVF
ncbi:MAG: RNA polymerase sigma factor SigX [Thermoanaerobacterales bacterium]|nr:RNA polymerase sigma factor SigX [Thermoanaerobacterales bacterium]